jgi:hypothetical protein
VAHILVSINTFLCILSNIFAYPKSHAKRVHLYICFEGIIQSTTKKDITKKTQTLKVPEETTFEQKEEGKTLKPLRMRFLKKYYYYSA